MPAASWTDEDIQRLRELAGEGLSASQIATELGRVSRNSVVGKLHRLGIVKTGAAPKPKRVYERKFKPRLAAANNNKVTKDLNEASLKVAIIGLKPLRPIGTVYSTVPPSPEAQPCTILELNNTNCHWPLDPNFCGAVAVDGKPYCAHHSRIAYRKPGEYR